MDLAGVANVVDLGARALALAGAGLSAVVALTHWAVRRRHLTPFGAWPKVVRQVSDPLLRPIERGLVKRGASPQDASLWLVGIAVVAGLTLVMVVRWTFGLIYSVIALTQAPASVWLRLLVGGVFSVLMVALFIRFAARWFGVSPYAPAMRLLAAMTDWLLVPIRKVLPPLGIIDASPIAAYFLLMLLRGLVLSVFFPG